VLNQKVLTYLLAYLLEVETMFNSRRTMSPVWTSMALSYLLNGSSWCTQ